MSQDLNTTIPTYSEPDTPPGSEQLGWLAALLQCNDSAYPVGSFAHSFGLEGMVQEGIISDTESLMRFLAGPVRHGLGHIDLPLLSKAHRAAGEGDVDKLVELDLVSAACRASSELREAARRVGRQRLAMLRSVWGRESRLVLPDLPSCQAPIVSGIEAYALGVPVEAAMVSYAHGSFAAVLSAAIKLLRIGQTKVQSMLAECGRSIPKLVSVANRVSLDEIGSFAPLCDIASMRHERCPARMFLS